jgi:hypothetical protein
MRARYLFTFSIAVGLQAQQNPVDLLRSVQVKIADTLDRLPKYMCTQTIDRATYDPDIYSGDANCDTGPARPVTHLTSSDRLRFDVAMSSTGEMYSWVGERRFDDRDLQDMVQGGAISTGNFTALLILIFHEDDANFTYEGDSTENGRTLAEFGFRVSWEKSHYRFGEPSHSAVVTGYDGSFLVDANTGDLVRLVIRTSKLPSETAACYATTTTYYARVRLDDIDTLLFPTESHLQIVNTNRTESENHTVFAACHKFLGESTIKFEPPSDGPAPGAQKDQGSRGFIPPGLPFRVALTEGIDTATAAAGDPIKVRLITPIQEGSKVVVPAGAAIAGRITRIQYFYGSISSLELNIELETVVVAGTSVRLIAAPDAGQTFRSTKGRTPPRRIELGTLRGLEDRTATFVFRDVHQPYLIGSGLESMWVTANAAPGDSASTQSK